MGCCSCHINRREFLGVSAATAAATVTLASSSFAKPDIENWDPHKPLLSIGKPISVQPILMYTISTPKKQRSYKSWGGIQTHEAAQEEVVRISREMKKLAGNAEFDVIINPVKTASSVEEAQRIHQANSDVAIVFPARGGGDLLRACFSPIGNTLVFVRHRSGPVYYWYEALSTRYLETSYKAGENNKPVHVDDVVVDDYEELLWKLRALYGVKNFLNTKIVALGGAMGKYSAQAPQIARDQFNMDIVDVSYGDLEKRIASAKNDKNLLKQTKEWTNKYLSLPNTTLATERIYVENGFLLYSLFKDLMNEAGTSTFTIKDCMATIMPMANTTACLTLGLLLDEGYNVFCESDFVIIPPGILLRHISGKPVFLHNSTFPHKAEITAAHCVGPRRMDGDKYEPCEVTTHYESEFGAAPKVDMPIGQSVSFIDPEYSTGRWLGFTGKVKRNPYYEICRSQQDIEILGNWKKLKAEARDSHWVMVYDDYTKECGFAARKLGLSWEDLS